MTITLSIILRFNASGEGNCDSSLLKGSVNNISETYRHTLPNWKKKCPGSS